MFIIGQANGDAVVDFAGNGASAGDSLQFVGYGAGATFTNIDATHWQVNFNGGASHEVIAFSNGASIIRPTSCSRDQAALLTRAGDLEGASDSIRITAWEVRDDHFDDHRHRGG